VARKNAKSTLLAVIALYLLAVDGEAGSEVYSAATTRDQARIVFDTAKKMAEREADFCQTFGVRVFRDSLVVDDSASSMKALSAEGNTLDGLNPHGAIIDELHAHRTREVWDVLETATGARSQPLIAAITTAGSNRAGICYEIRGYLCQVLNSTLKKHDGMGYPVGGDSIEDETIWGAIYTLDDDDDWTDESVWIKANPNLGVSVHLDDMQRQAKKAMSMASAQPNFLTKRLDVWVNADSAWMDMRAWDRQTIDGNWWRDSESASEWASKISSEYQGWTAYMGVDLASKVDVASCAILLSRDGEWRLFTRHWLPEDAILESDNSQYRGWSETGAIQSTDGNTLDHETVTADIEIIASILKPRAIGYDPGFDLVIPQMLQNKGLPMIAVRPLVINFSEPMKHLEAAIIGGKLQHDGNPAMSWMISNVVCHRDSKDNIYPRKQTESAKIDGAVAAIIALNQAIGSIQTASVFNGREVYEL